MRDEAKRGDGNAKGTACTPKPWHRCVILSEIHERREMDVVEGSIHGTEYLFMNRFFNFAPIWGFVQNDSKNNNHRLPVYALLATPGKRRLPAFAEATA